MTSIIILLPLIILALIDSTSIGTMVIPLWIMTSPVRIKSSKLFGYLVLVAVIYFFIGLLITNGIIEIEDSLAKALESKTAYVFQLIIGGLLMFISFYIDPVTKKGKAKKAKREHLKNERGKQSRLNRWREDVSTGTVSIRKLIVLAFSAVALEIPLMLPYLAAISMISTADALMIHKIFALLGYCLIMIFPAIILLLLRHIFSKQLLPILVKIEKWLTKHSQGTIAVIVFILGLLLAFDAIDALNIDGIIEAYFNK